MTFTDDILQVQQDKDSFCAAYECHLDDEGGNEGWDIGFEVCICPKKVANKERVERVSKDILKNIPLCCEFGVTLQDESGFHLHLFLFIFQLVTLLLALFATRIVADSQDLSFGYMKIIYL